MDGIPVQLLAASGPAIGWTLAASAVWMILTGRLVPRALYDEQKRAADTWREAWQVEQDKTQRLLVPSAELTKTVLRSIPHANHAEELAE